MTKTFQIPESELEFDFSTSGGPGGQNVNKVETKVRLSFDLSASTAFTEVEKARIFSDSEVRRFLIGLRVIVITSQRFRSQVRNREDAVEKLYGLLSQGLVRRTPRRPTKQSRASKARQLDKKKKRGSLKKDRRKPHSE